LGRSADGVAVKVSRSESRHDQKERGDVDPGLGMVRNDRSRMKRIKSNKERKTTGQSTDMLSFPEFGVKMLSVLESLGYIDGKERGKLLNDILENHKNQPQGFGRMQQRVIMNQQRKLRQRDRVLHEPFIETLLIEIDQHRERNATTSKLHPLSTLSLSSSHNEMAQESIDADMLDTKQVENLMFSPFVASSSESKASSKSLSTIKGKPLPSKPKPKPKIKPRIDGRSTRVRYQNPLVLPSLGSVTSSLVFDKEGSQLAEGSIDDDRSMISSLSFPKQEKGKKKNQEFQLGIEAKRIEG
jgi:hypothetical protein